MSFPSVMQKASADICVERNSESYQEGGYLR